jgi:pimeloyl-ACP methyl ester carboxylesterase
MHKIINDVAVNYIDYGIPEGIPLVFLPGWGQNIEMMKPLGDAFITKNRIIIIDLPGFGDSDEPRYAWDVYDYAECVHNLMVELHIDNPIMVGHSYGGKIGLVYASKYQTEKLILFGSPFKKEIEKLSMKTKILKSLKKVPVLNKLEGFAKRHIGSTDYKQASPLMRQVLVNTVNLDVTKDIKQITCSALIVWGEHDEAVPLNDAYELSELIEDAGVVVFPGTHYAYLENLKQTINVMRIFIES